jgi:hypothetical protein
MSKRGYEFWIILVGVLIAAMAIGPDLWAAPGQYPERQTVPTRTPTLLPTESLPPPPTATSHPPKDQPTPVPTAAVEATPTAAPVEPLLPTAGGWNTGLHVGVAMIVTGLLLIVAVRRRA